mmetsp:Transcript_882/g.525  ORF Transcript_882/g.525 Transcript_882/m.525 type:complete len:149 (+) Transcript_882:42-488(+)|eukprot:CAMPEP_0202972210 /NCGR_PEP_ID=MMETSP1396-20130829/34390_1 /ASSEMBLY_ACC=CAM_ASM_000872 /TAXON_ID= /ORGANISM="Pseudokeronopsis sp., Strain Brazil" /LENGTH=148 /DNA_ID=CAMNT_0049702377 /DNA_START=42 /DNA_END=488 /DNA_ORIENTATION=-
MFARAFRGISTQKRFPTRKFHIEGKRMTEIKETSADESSFINKYFHKSGAALILLSPLALILPAKEAFPVDLLLGVVIPFHSHVALNIIVSDYVPKQYRSGSRFGILALTLLAAGGILKLNLEGPGLTGTIKALWADKKKANDADSHH